MWLVFLSSCLPHTDGMPGRHNSEVWDLGHRRTGALPQPRPHVLQGRPGCHRGLWHHQYSESGGPLPIQMYHSPLTADQSNAMRMQCDESVIGYFHNKAKQYCFRYRFILDLRFGLAGLTLQYTTHLFWNVHGSGYNIFLAFTYHRCFKNLMVE